MKVYNVKKAAFTFFAAMMLVFMSGSIFGQNMFRKINDFSGDGKADYVVTRNVDGQKVWYVWQSVLGPISFQWGLGTDLEAAGDWDNDGRTDYSVYRKVPSTCNPNCSSELYQYWLFLSSTNSFEGRIMHNAPGATTTSFAQDYTGDGKVDRAVLFNAQATPYVKYFGQYNDLLNVNFNAGDTPLRLGDMTGDGKADFVTVNQNNIVTIRNSMTNALQSIQFGLPGDEYVPADFDGDGKGDLAVFRQSDGTWWYIRSSDSSVRSAQFGMSGDKPVPADYDGDGKTDLAIWRPGTSQSVYWVYGSMGNIWAVEFGIPTDTVVRY